MLILRSSLFALGFWGSLIAYQPILLVARFLPARLRLAVVSGWNRFAVFWLRVTCGVRWQVEGEIPSGGGVILAKHQSTWETLFLPTVLPGPAFVLKRELLRIPFFGWGLALTDPIAIDRGTPRDAMRQVMEQGKGILAQGRWVIIFPEGTRTRPGERIKYKPGGALLAAQNDARVLPMAHNAGCAWPRGQFIKQPCTITVRFGPVIETAGRSASEVHAEAEAWIEGQMETLPCPDEARA